MILGTIGIPTICLLLLLAIPFIDTRTERRLLRRPVAIIAAILVVLSMGVLTYKGATAKEALGSELVGHVPTWAAKQGFTDNPQAIAGAKLFAVSGCLNCHTYLGDGGHNLGAPDLSAEGAKNKGIAFQIAHLKCPSCVNPGSPMPSFAGLGDERLHAARRVPRGLQGPEVMLRRLHVRLVRVRVFLGITGASGAPYARRLLQSLAAADCEVGVSVSGAAIEVLATELYGDARLSRDETLARFIEGTGDNVTVYEPNDWKAPYASGSAKVDAYVICPCSMGTLGTIASGAMQNLIHRAASVALKEERKLVLCPRETPLSTIHLENMLTLRRAGATILFLAPGFYHGAETVDDLVDFVVARVLDQLGLDNALVPRWGQP